MGYPINNTRSPRVMNASPPTLTRPLLLNRSDHCILSRSFGSGVCNQSSFSTSSGNSSKPAEGIMLNFSLTVCVLTPSSSLPALDGARESSVNGFATNGPFLLSLLPSEPDDHDVLRLWVGERRLSSSRNLRVLLFRGGSNSSVDSAGVALWYRGVPPGAGLRGAVPGRGALFVIKDLEDCCRDVCGRGCC